MPQGRELIMFGVVFVTSTSACLPACPVRLAARLPGCVVMSKYGGSKIVSSHFTNLCFNFETGKFDDEFLKVI